MHFLLIPYALLCGLFVAMWDARRQSYARVGMLIACSLTMMLLFMVMWWRPVAGDSWRYMEYFKEIRGMDLADALQFNDPDPLYALLNWVVGHLGADPALLFGATLLVYFVVFIAAMRRLMSPVEVLVVLMSYSAFPFFVAYGVNGLRQGISLVFLLMAYVSLAKGQRSGWIWALLAPFWHSGAWLGLTVLLAHQLMCKFVKSQKLRWRIVFFILAASILLSFSGLNENLISRLPIYFGLNERHEIYFTDAQEYDYRAGFRPDFLVFSLLPLVTGFLLRRKGKSFDYTGAGWWLSLYLCLNVIYHLFAFAPFADRFAGYSWFLMPLVVFMQVRHVSFHKPMTVFVMVICSMNLVMLQFYTGKFIPIPRIW